jgi:hypothetical protein
LLIETLVVSLGLESVTELEKEITKLTFEYQNTTDIYTELFSEPTYKEQFQAFVAISQFSLARFVDDGEDYSNW